jgi:hypothetical protein
VAPAEACTGTVANCWNAPAGVYATTFTRASACPGTVTNSRAALLATVKPGITRVVDGSVDCGTQAPRPVPSPSQTEAAI